MPEPIDPISWLEEAIFRLKDIKNRWHIADVHRIVAEVRNEILRPLLAELKRQESGIPVLQPITTRVRKLTEPELLDSAARALVNDEPVLATPAEIAEAMLAIVHAALALARGEEKKAQDGL